jgi:hypothetical protein
MIKKIKNILLNQYEKVIPKRMSTNIAIEKTNILEVVGKYAKK